jgi:adenylate kinase
MGETRKQVCGIYPSADQGDHEFYRGYSLKNIEENNEAEIMQVVLDEARSSYPAQIVVELHSDGLNDLEANVNRIVDWIEAWRKDRGFDKDN